jgi:UDP-glucose 4-epimerase
MNFTGKRVLITGGTGSLGKVLTRRLLSGAHGYPERVVVFSRDEAKQHDMRIYYQNRVAATDEVIYRNSREMLEFRIGDVRDPAAIGSAVRGIDIVFAAAALKQVPSCEYFPSEAVKTNIQGAVNLVEAIKSQRTSVECVVGISTDKAVKPVNVMGMTKALQERVYSNANLECENTRFVISRYGNVLASRGSVVPLFRHQILSGGPVTITHPEMTRFLLSLEDAVDLIVRAVGGGRRGETYIPRVPSARVVDVARALIDQRDISMTVTGVRPGEKIHEVLISEEFVRTETRGGDYVIAPILPELRERSASLSGAGEEATEYTSATDNLPFGKVKELLENRGLSMSHDIKFEDEMFV